MKGIWEEASYHSHQEYEIYIFHDGVCRYLINNQIYDLEPGDILLMDGLALHKPNVPRNSEYVRSVIHFSPQWIRGLLKELGGLYLLKVFEERHHYFIRTKMNDEYKKLETVIRRMDELEKFEDEENAEMEQKALFVQMLTIIHRIGEPDKLKQPGVHSEKIEHAEKIAAYIQQHYTEKVTIDMVASDLNISKSYVSHVFREMTGFTVMEYVMGSRLMRAKYLLEAEPSKPLKDIAFESGFESASHFSRYFKEKVGVTAKEYRQTRLKIYI
ncbi:AraC family transcriptional regulator [Salinicoccus sp. RF5]|uniref:AraC family transcriptional regulator n=1 Tax=Salinicoccus sp. RF5 TaxID=2748874 RepID=UPI001E37A4C2|nr:AraC family transcriptional regulator [Salinicoccus sp. RF5]MCC4723255.1 AraC family transcriptional regulator [Salinicoccus sp. RF5]